MTIDEAKEWLHKEVPTEILLERIYEEFKLELEAEYQRGRDSILSRTCEGCKFGIFGIDSVGYEIECTKKWQCARAMPDKWEQK